MEEIKYQGKFIKVTEEKIEDNIWERVYLQNGVQVFAIDHDNKFLLVEEKRPHEIHPTRLKFVTGLMDDNETDPLLTANRELQEEIGYKAQDLKIINHRHTSGTLNNHFYQILAKDLVPSKIPNPDGEDTIVKIHRFSMTEIKLLLGHGKLPWDMAALAIFLIEEQKLFKYPT